MNPRLTETKGLPAKVDLPKYDRAACGAGILHLGLGAFHRAHQAVATDDALAAEGGDWRIVGANLRSRKVTEALAEQNGLYTVLVRNEPDHARIIGSHIRTIGGYSAATLKAACDPAIRILSLTVSEKAYGIDRSAMDIDEKHPAVAADLAHPKSPQGVLGLIAAALSARNKAGIQPFTILSCDNLPDNGRLLRAGLQGFIQRTDPSLSNWIEDNVTFPSTMVDRITPATTDRTFCDVERMTGRRDLAAVETEAFSQWVIEDCFPHGRPLWEAGGAEFVQDVRPFEAMKLRMLNGAHSLIAYTGQLFNMTHVSDVIADAALAALIRRHLHAAAATLDSKAGMDTGAYSDALMKRFANPAIFHQTRQIAADGSEKLPQRWFAPAADALVARTETRPFAFATAVWLFWLTQLTASNETPDDPRGALLVELIRKAGNDDATLIASVLALPGLAPHPVVENAHFKNTVRKILTDIRREGLRATINSELAR